MSKELDFGIDIGLIRNRVAATIDLYNRNTVDLILNPQIPTSTGFSQVTSNVGKVQNKGIEVTLNSVNIVAGDFKWSTSLNFSANHNEIKELYGGDITADKGNGWFVGESLRSNYYYKFDGIWQTSEKDKAASYGVEPGAVKVVDKNNDGKISDSGEGDDRFVLGSELPKWIGGMTNTLNWKNFDFSVFAYTRQGVQFKNGMLSGTMGEVTNGRYNHLVLNYWTPDNPTNDYFGLNEKNPYRAAIEYQDASFVRIANITLGYTFPRSLLNKWKFQNFRIYGQINNPFVFTNYISFDPEYNTSTYRDNVPFTTYMFGVSVSI